MTMSDPPGYGPFQQPVGGYADGDAGGIGYGAGRQARSRYRRPDTRVAERDPVARKAPAKAPAKEPRIKKKEWKPTKNGPNASTSNIYILFYFSEISRTFKFDDFLARLHGSADPSRWPETSPFLMNGIDIIRKSNSDTVCSDLGNAVHESGAVVIYWGHSERAKGAKHARNLRPRSDSADAASDISVVQLGSLVQSMNAKCFILAACATNGCIGKVKRDTAIVSTDSGKDLLTNSLDWTNALEAFLRAFVDAHSIDDCIAAANKSFAKSSDPDDRFMLTSGLGSLTLHS